MHELALTEAIVEACLARCEGRRVLRVTLQVGTLSCVMPEALRFCFAVAGAGTLLDNATLELVRVPALARCRDCGADVAMDDFLARCPCGSEHLGAPRGGDGLRIVSMEIETPALEAS